MFSALNVHVRVFQLKNRQIKHINALLRTSIPHTHERLTALFQGLPRWAGTRKVKPIWILLEQQTMSGSGISWAICKSALRSRQITMPASHCSVFYRPDALPAAQRTASKHWRKKDIYQSSLQTRAYNRGLRFSLTLSRYVTLKSSYCIFTNMADW